MGLGLELELGFGVSAVEATTADWDSMGCCVDSMDSLGWDSMDGGWDSMDSIDGSLCSLNWEWEWE